MNLGNQLQLNAIKQSPETLEYLKTSITRDILETGRTEPFIINGYLPFRKDRVALFKWGKENGLRIKPFILFCKSIWAVKRERWYHVF